MVSATVVDGNKSSVFANFVSEAAAKMVEDLFSDKTLETILLPYLKEELSHEELPLRVSLGWSNDPSLLSITLPLSEELYWTASLPELADEYIESAGDDVEDKAEMVRIAEVLTGMAKKLYAAAACIED